jgi:hypothetical protein
MTQFNCIKCSLQITNQQLNEGDVVTDGVLCVCPSCGTTQTIPKDQISNVDIPTSTGGILTKIYYSLVSQEEFLIIKNVIDTKASFLAGLEGENWFLCRYVAEECFQEGKITQNLRDRILACIPPSEPDEINGP